jgi:hypothetical protein
MSKFKFRDIVKNKDGDVGVVFHVYRKDTRTIVRVGYPTKHEGRMGHTRGEDPWDLELVESDPAPPPPNTVRVRIAVAVADDGGWSARGGSGESDRYVASRAGEDLTNARVSWVTVDVPLPEKPAEIQGVVE